MDLLVHHYGMLVWIIYMVLAMEWAPSLMCMKVSHTLLMSHAHPNIL